MQTFATSPTVATSLTPPPLALAEPANFIAAITGCAFTDGLAIALAILGGAAGPLWRTSTPAGAELSCSFNVFVSPSVDTALAVSELRGQLDFEFGKRIALRAGMSDNTLANKCSRTAAVMREVEEALAAHQLRLSGTLHSGAIERRAALQEAVMISRTACADAEFMRRPWILSDSTKDLRLIAADAFDESLFVHLSDAGEEIRDEASRMIIAGFSGHAISLNSKSHVRPVISNLWIGRLPTALPPHLQTFVFVEPGRVASESIDEGLENWSKLISGVFNARLQRHRAYIPPSAEAAVVFNSKRHAWRNAIARAPQERFGALTNVPVEALKIAALFAMAYAFETNEQPEEIHEHWMQAGFEHAEYFAQKVWAMPLKPVEDRDDIMHLIDRLVLNGPMTRREIRRSYHKASVSEVNRWLAEGAERRMLVIDGNLVKLVDATGSVAARQRPEPNIQIHA